MRLCLRRRYRPGTSARVALRPDRKHPAQFNDPVEVNTFTGGALIRGSTAKPKAHVNTINRFFELVHAERYEAGVRQGSVYLRDKRKGNASRPRGGAHGDPPTLSIMTIMAEEYDAYFVKRWRALARG